MTERTTETDRARSTGARRSVRAAAAGAGVALLLPLAAACGEQAPAASAPISTPALAPVPVGTPATATPTPTANATGSADPAAPASTETATSPTAAEPPPAEDVADEDQALEAAQDYLRVRAAGDAEAAWAALSSSAQATWPDRATHDQAVLESTPTYAALLEVSPAILTMTTGSGRVHTAYGTVDPDGSPQVVAITVVTDANAQVQQGPSDSGPELTWANPTLDGAGSLGLAELDTGAPLSVRLGPGAFVAAISFDGSVPEAHVDDAQEGEDASTVTVAELPDGIDPGLHVITVVYGYPGQITQAQALLVETGQP